MNEKCCENWENCSKSDLSDLQKKCTCDGKYTLLCCHECETCEQLAKEYGYLYCLKHEDYQSVCNYVDDVLYIRKWSKMGPVMAWIAYSPLDRWLVGRPSTFSHLK